MRQIVAPSTKVHKGFNIIQNYFLSILFGTLYRTIYLHLFYDLI